MSNDEQLTAAVLALYDAVELHRPVMFDRHAYRTDDPAEMKYRRCLECSRSLLDGESCKTWRTAHPS